MQSATIERSDQTSKGDGCTELSRVMQNTIGNGYLAHTFIKAGGKILFNDQHITP